MDDFQCFFLLTFMSHQKKGGIHESNRIFMGTFGWYRLTGLLHQNIWKGEEPKGHPVYQVAIFFCLHAISFPILVNYSNRLYWNRLFSFFYASWTWTPPYRHNILRIRERSIKHIPFLPRFWKPLPWTLPETYIRKKKRFKLSFNGLP